MRLCNRLGALLVVWAVEAVAGRSQSVDPKPVQVTVDFVFPPSPIFQTGVQHLVYELVLTNYGSQNYTLDGVDVKAGDRSFTFSGPDLKSLLRLMGDKTGEARSPVLEAGHSFVGFLTLDLDRASEIPRTLEHAIHFTAQDTSKHTVDAVLNVRQHVPIIVAPPLRGTDWLAMGATGPNSYHRRALMVEGGHAWPAQRYAIDFAKFHMVEGKAFTWKGPEDQNSSYFCYDDEIHNVAPGTVTEVFGRTSGERAALRQAGHRSHLAKCRRQPRCRRHRIWAICVLCAYAAGSVAVKVGDLVTTGQVLGHVGNTGSSSEPHPHFHIVDRPQFLSGQGIPYEFTKFSTSPRIEVANPEGWWSPLPALVRSSPSKTTILRRTWL
jgi:peptidase M23-like protein